MNIYKKFPGFNKYRINIGVGVIILYILCITIMVVKPFPKLWTTIIGISGTVVFLFFYIFCMVWDEKQFLNKLDKYDYDR
jgi:glucan phosphoethanolaminetransferase (alkaline phosphatase superfamily)